MNADTRTGIITACIRVGNNTTPGGAILRWKKYKRPPFISYFPVDILRVQLSINIPITPTRPEAKMSPTPSDSYAVNVRCVQVIRGSSQPYYSDIETAQRRIMLAQLSADEAKPGSREEWLRTYTFVLLLTFSLISAGRAVFAGTNFLLWGSTWPTGQ
ncbi:hypothetical protein EI94DRAFT_1316339 [Lactarius quietus]|nr:hypothetical protein EI94DRAFT_1316339 [Lactarius quietus]